MGEGDKKNLVTIVLSVYCIFVDVVIGTETVVMQKNRVK
jgi:hypothetical protein